MSKQVFLVAAVLCLFFPGCKKESPPSEPVQQAKPELPPADQLGAKTTFEVTYRGITAKGDDLYASGGWGFGSNDDQDSKFIQSVRKKAEHKISIIQNPFLHDRLLTAVEYNGKEVLHAYFDLNADGNLSDEEQLTPADVSEANRRGNDSTVFLTPDFIVTDEQGQKTPFRVMLWANFYGDQDAPNVTWSPMGVYEGVAELGGQPVQLYLFPDFNSKCYAKYGRSRYALVAKPQKNNGYIPQSPFSSLIVYDNSFYRMTLDEVNPASQTIKVSLFEDKTPRGKFALDIKGKEDSPAGKLASASLQGVTDKTIYFQIQKNMDQLPVGDYVISYGSINFGEGDPPKYFTSFQNIPAFSVKENQTAMIEMGKPQIKIQAVEENKRYNDDKVYKTEFAEGTNIYIDASFVGIAKESYRGFSQYVQKENHINFEDIKGRIVIADDKGNEVIAKDLEYG